MMKTYRPASRIWQYAAPSTVVVSLSDMKLHCRVDGTESDAAITAFSAAAVAAVEARIQRLLTPRTAVLRLPNLPYGRTPIELPGGAVASITSVVADGETITGYEAIGDAPALLVPTADWPVLSDPKGFPVVVTYVVGYAVPPADLVGAVKLIAGEMNERRENGETGPINPVVVSAEYLIAPHRIWSASS
jgi:uncharacterized phiE125 gp8 family phage protein